MIVQFTRTCNIEQQFIKSNLLGQGDDLKIVNLDSQINKHLECTSLIQQEELTVTLNLHSHLP